MSQLHELASNLPVVPQGLPLEEVLVGSYPPRVLNPAAEADRRSEDGDDEHRSQLGQRSYDLRADADLQVDYADVMFTGATGPGVPGAADQAQKGIDNARRMTDAADEAATEALVLDAEATTRRAVVPSPFRVREVQGRLGRGALLISSTPGAVVSAIFGSTVAVETPSTDILVYGSITSLVIAITAALSLRRTARDQIAYYRARKRLAAASQQSFEVTE